MDVSQKEIYLTTEGQDIYRQKFLTSRWVFFLDIVLFLDNVFLLKEAAENKKCLFFKHTVKSLSPK